MHVIVPCKDVTGEALLRRAKLLIISEKLTTFSLKS